MIRWKRKVNNNLRGAFGETDYGKRTITINKKRHKNKAALKKFPKIDQTLLNTIVHEETHAAHPRMLERTVRKVARRKTMTMSIKEKNKLYGRY